MTDREILAAEYALRLLEGEELMEARRLHASDQQFAADVEAWEARLAPLLREITPVEPGAELWTRIERALADQGASAEILVMRRRLRLWQGAAALAAAAAVALALVAVPPLVQPPPSAPPPPVEERSSPVLIASLGDEQAPGAVAVTFVSEARELLVTTSAVAGRSGRDYQLWLIPEGGSPLSLGLVATDQPSRRHIPSSLAAQFRTGATVALSEEPTGGSPTGQPTGPVLATGGLEAL